MSGYSGGEMLRLLVGHPAFEVCWLGGDTSSGLPLSEVHAWIESYPAAYELSGMEVQSIGATEDLSGLDVLFTCLPAGESSRLLASLGSRGPARVIDLGPDFRLPEKTYTKWYGKDHPLKEELGEWVYGFTEGYRCRIAKARYVANPGCYAYAALLALYPLAKQGVIEGRVFLDGKSGLSGAGRVVERRLLLSEAAEDTVAYAVGGHRHQPEIEHVLEDLCGPVSVVFVPHLVPMTRGLLVTAYVPLRSGITSESVLRAFSDSYEKEPFIAIVSAPPHTKVVRGSNMAAVHVVVREDEVGGGVVAVVTVAIDNLGKGAAGSAVHNANVMLGLDETAGLDRMPLWP